MAVIAADRRSRPFLGEPGTFGAGDEGFGED
jgi:hypothetical protein